MIKMEDLLTQIKNLSSGTMATLTGYTRYNDLDAIQYSFLLWTKRNASNVETWQDAWMLFTEQD